VFTGPRKYSRAFGKQKHLVGTEKRPWNDPNVKIQIFRSPINSHLFPGAPLLPGNLSDTSWILVDQLLDSIHKYAAHPDEALEALGIRAIHNETGYTEYPFDPFLFGLKYEEQGGQVFFSKEVRGKEHKMTKRKKECVQDIMALFKALSRLGWEALVRQAAICLSEMNVQFETSIQFNNSALNTDGLFDIELDYNLKYKDSINKGSIKVDRWYTGDKLHTRIKETTNNNFSQLDIETNKTIFNAKYIVDTSILMDFESKYEPGKHIKVALHLPNKTFSFEAGLKKYTAAQIDAYFNMDVFGDKYSGELHYTAGRRIKMAIYLPDENKSLYNWLPHNMPIGNNTIFFDAGFKKYTEDEFDAFYDIEYFSNKYKGRAYGDNTDKNKPKFHVDLNEGNKTVFQSNGKTVDGIFHIELPLDDGKPVWHVRCNVVDLDHFEFEHDTDMMSLSQKGSTFKLKYDHAGKEICALSTDMLTKRNHAETGSVGCLQSLSPIFWSFYSAN
jgi:hypothetical protein